MIVENHYLTVVDTVIPARLFIGGAPALRDAAAYDVVVSAAKEVRPPSGPSYQSIHLPMEDDELAFRRSPELAKAVLDLAEYVADAVCAGQRVLVVCAMGLNRSALVTALALTRLGYSPARAVKTLRRRHPLVLSNRSFHRAVHSLAPRKDGAGIFGRSF